MMLPRLTQELVPVVGCANYCENRVNNRARSNRILGLAYPSKVVDHGACAYNVNGS